MSRDTFYTQPYINSLPVVEHSADRIDYHDETGVYTITSEQEEFKILHLTDIHLGGSLFSYRQDHKALAACYKLIENTHPDLVIVTGDLCFPLGIMSMSFNNSAPVYLKYGRPFTGTVNRSCRIVRCWMFCWDSWMEKSMITWKMGSTISF